MVAATSGQVASRISPRLVDLLAALATGAVGSVALARSDISDTLPGVAIAISLVPPLAVVGLTLESGAPHQALGSFLLFVTNVIAILASGIVVMGLYRVRRTSATTDHRSPRYALAVLSIGLLLLAVIVPLWVNSQRFDRSSIRLTGVQAVADHWADAAGWAVLGVSNLGENVCSSTSPAPAQPPAWLISVTNSTPPGWATSRCRSSCSPAATSRCPSKKRSLCQAAVAALGATQSVDAFPRVTLLYLLRCGAQTDEART